MGMFNLLNECCMTTCKLIHHGKLKIYNTGHPVLFDMLAERYSVCAFRNISYLKNEITDAKSCNSDSDPRKCNKNISPIAFGFSNACFCKTNNDCIYLNNYQKFNLHTTSYLFSPKKYESDYQNNEKREANILIALSLFLVTALCWAWYNVDFSPYDKPIQKTSNS